MFATLALLLALGNTIASPPPEDDCGLLSPAHDNVGPLPEKPRPWTGGLTDRAPVTRVRSGPLGPHHAGVLAGKTVYISQGHGFVWTDFGWRTQRGTHNDIVEDLVSAEAVDQFLIPYLHAMGAYVVPLREPDMNPDTLIVDDDDASLEDLLLATGATDEGWGPVPLPLTDNTRPFTAGSAQQFIAESVDTGRLVYPTPAPRSAAYNVYISYAQAPDRAPDAHWIVRHAGGESHFRVDQRRHGTTWVLLGKFWFEAGAGPDRAAVVLAGDSDYPGTILSADAVRLGGGTDMIDRGGGLSGRPMYEHAARYYTQWAGAPESVFDYLGADNNDDVVSRSRFTAWEHEDGEDSVYVAWHSNAPNPKRGTSSYTYGPSAPPGPLGEFSGTPGSRELQDAVHAEIVDDLRAVWDPEWTDEGRFTAYFGEVNPTHNPEIPAVLLEVAYHDTPLDADALRDPRFRRLVARAIAQGIARYFCAKDGSPYILPPEPPTAIAIRNDGARGLTVTWRPPTPDDAAGDPPTHYRIYQSRDGHAFDDGTDVFGDSFTFEGLSVDDVRYVKIAAVNMGGHSLPSEVLGARVAPSGRASLAIVAGYDRLDSGLLLVEDLSAFALGDVQRMWLARMNDGTYAVRHGAAIADVGLSFDSATDDALAADLLDLRDYKAVDWFAGQESIGDEPFTAASRDLLADYLDHGGRLLVSGSELGWALDHLGSPEEREFYRSRLRATYVDDDAQTHDVTALSNPFTNLPTLSFHDPESHDVASPDVVESRTTSLAALAYSGGKPGTAAVAWGAQSDQRGVYLAFPFETILGADTRVDVMARVLEFFAVEEDPPPHTDDTGDPDPSTTTADDTAADTTGEPPADTTSDTTTPTEQTTGATDDPAGEQSGDGCGCTTSAPSAPWLLTLLLLRRRRTCPSGQPSPTPSPM